MFCCDNQLTDRSPIEVHMLYQFHDLNRSLLNPMMYWAEASSRLFTDPASPFSYAPFAHRIAAGYELMYRLGKQYEKPHFGIESVEMNGKSVAIVEEIAEEKSFCTLLHFKKDLSAKEFGALKQPTILLV